MKPAFLTAPARWTCAPRLDQTPAAYASAVERYRAPHTVGDKAVWAACAVGFVAVMVLLLAERFA